MICPTFRLFHDFFLNNKEKTMRVSKEIFDTYMKNMQASQREQTKVSDTKARWFGMGSERFIEVK